jgi:hypothetical protein
MNSLRIPLVTGWLLTFSAGLQSADRAQDCVTIATPRSTLGYTYQHIESTGRKSVYTDRWESVTETGSRVRTTRGGAVTIQVNRHHIADDVAVLDESRQVNARGGVIQSTKFRPGIVSDPAFRACAGRSWRVPAVTASFRSMQNSTSAATPAGTLRIVAIRESVTVPAGTFATVHYVRTSQSVDEYWKSIEHGVVVKHVGKLPGATVTDVLTAIK